MTKTKNTDSPSISENNTSSQSLPMDSFPLPPLPFHAVPAKDTQPATVEQDKTVGWLTILNGEWQGSFYPVTRGCFTFGCASGNDFTLPAMDKIAGSNHFSLLVPQSSGEIAILPGAPPAPVLIDENIITEPYPLAGGEIITAGDLRLQWTSLYDGRSLDNNTRMARPTSGPEQNDRTAHIPDNGPPTTKFLFTPPVNTEQYDTERVPIPPPFPPNSIQTEPSGEWEKQTGSRHSAPAAEKATLTLPTAEFPRFLSSYINCIGDREEQQDASACWPGPGRESWFGVVADGAGGHMMGGVAAKTAIRTIDFLRKNKGPEVFKDTLPWLTDCLVKANAAIVNATNGRGRATIAALRISNSRFYSAHMGDTRIYQIRNEEIIFRTRDDSVAQILYDQGEISESEISTHPGQSRLLKALGDPRDIEPNLHKGDCRPGDIFLLCSDGFWTHFNNGELISHLSRFAEKNSWTGPGSSGKGEELRKTMENMAECAIARGRGKADNVSASIVVCSPDA